MRQINHQNPGYQDNTGTIISLIESTNYELTTKSLVFENNADLQTLNKIQDLLMESSEVTLDINSQQTILYLLTTILNASIFYDDENEPNTVQINFETSYLTLQIIDQSKYQFPTWFRLLSQDLNITLINSRANKTKMRTRSSSNFADYVVPSNFQHPINFLVVIKTYLNPYLPDLFFELIIPLLNQVSRYNSVELSQIIGIGPFLSIFKHCEQPQQLLIITMLNQMIQIRADESYCQYLDSLLEMSNMCYETLHNYKLANQLSYAQVSIIKSLASTDPEKSSENAQKISESYVHSIFDLVLEQTVPIIQNRLRDDDEKRFYIHTLAIANSLIQFKKFFIDFMEIFKSHVFWENASQTSTYDYQFDFGKLIFVFKEKPLIILTLLHRIFSTFVFYFFKGNQEMFTKYMRKEFTEEDFEKYKEPLEPEFNDVIDTVREIALSTQPALIHLITMGILDDDLFLALKCFKETLFFQVPPFSAIRGKFMSVLVIFALTPPHNKRKIQNQYNYRAINYLPGMFGRSVLPFHFINGPYGMLLHRHERLMQLLGNSSPEQRRIILNRLRSRQFVPGFQPASTTFRLPLNPNRPLLNEQEHNEAENPIEHIQNNEQEQNELEPREHNEPENQEQNHIEHIQPNGQEQNELELREHNELEHQEQNHIEHIQPNGQEQNEIAPNREEEQNHNEPSRPNNGNELDHGIYDFDIPYFDFGRPFNHDHNDRDATPPNRTPQANTGALPNLDLNFFMDIQTPRVASVTPPGTGRLNQDNEQENENANAPNRNESPFLSNGPTSHNEANPLPNTALNISNQSENDENEEPFQSEFNYTNTSGAYQNKHLVLRILLFFADQEEIADSFYIDLLKFNQKDNDQLAMIGKHITSTQKVQKSIEKYKKDFQSLEEKVNQYRQSHQFTLTEEQINELTLDQISDLILNKAITKVSFLKDGLINRCLTILNDIEQRKGEVSAEQKYKEEQAAITIIKYCFELINMIPIKLTDFSLTKTIAPVLQYLQNSAEYKYKFYSFRLQRLQFMSTLEALINMKEGHMNKSTLIEYASTKPEIMRLFKTDLESITWPSQFAYLYRALEHPLYQRKIILVGDKLYTHMDSQCRVFAENTSRSSFSTLCSAFNESDVKNTLKIISNKNLVNDHNEMPNEEMNEEEEEYDLNRIRRALLYSAEMNEEEEEMNENEIDALLRDARLRHQRDNIDENSLPEQDKDITQEQIQQDLRSIITPPQLKEKYIKDIFPVLHLLSRFHQVFVSDETYKSFYNEDIQQYQKYVAEMTKEHAKSEQNPVPTESSKEQNENDSNIAIEKDDRELIPKEVSNELLESFINNDFCSLIKYLISPDDIILFDSPALATIISYPMLFPFNLRSIALKLWTFPSYSAIRVYSRELLNKDGNTTETRTNGDEEDVPPLEEQVIYLIVDRYDKEKGDPDIFFQQGCEIMKRFAPNPESLEIEFRGEEGTGRGPTHEFFTHFSRMFCQIKFGLFRNPNSQEEDQIYCNDPLGMFPSFDADPSMFTILGILCAKAIQMECLIDIYINPAFFKLCRNKVIGINEVDPQIASSLEHKEDFIGFPSFEFMNHELIENGKEQEVTEENVDQFIDAVSNLIIGDGVKNCVESFMNGFEQVMSFKSLTIFAENEISLLLCGSLDVEITEDDFEHNIIYENGYTSQSPPILNFKDIVLNEMSKEDQQALIQFITGFNRLPLEGLASVRPILSISRMLPLTSSNSDKTEEKIDSLLPTVSTCLNSLKLPAYSTKEIMKEKLITAIREGKGFQKL